jgi:DNA-binding SARP family transcriptional activator/DNA-binding beta-propeller fold protein YncE
LWGDRPPDTAPTALHGYVSGLRKVLGQARIETRTPGYLLHTSPGESDLERFEQALAESRSLPPAAAADRLAAALSLWRGPALADLDGLPFAEQERARLDALRLTALEERLTADLALGRHGNVIVELETLVRAHPSRERLRELLMLALYRSGRQADALEVYRQGRRLLSEELGLEPSDSLQQLQRAILKHDPKLEPTAAPTHVPSASRRGRGIRLALLAAATLTVGAIALAISVFAGGHKVPLNAPAVVPNSLVDLDPRTGQVVSVTPMGVGPMSLAVTRDAVWVVNRGDRTVSRVDLRTHSVRTLGGVPLAYDIAAEPGDTIWVSSGQVSAVTPITTGAQGWPAAPQRPRSIHVSSHAGSLAIGGGYLWVTSGAGTGRATSNTVSRIDLRSEKLMAPIRVGDGPLWLAFGYGAAWTSNRDSDTVSVIRPGSAHPNTIRLPNRDGQPAGITVGAGSVWVVTENDFLVGIDPSTRRITHQIPLDSGHLAMRALSASFAAGKVWVTDKANFSISEIDPASSRVVHTFPVGQFPAFPCGVSATATAIWVTIGSAPSCSTAAHL